MEFIEMTAKKSRSSGVRTNPIAQHRDALRRLRATGVLIGPKVGIRNVVDADLGVVRPVDLDVPDAEGAIFRPDNFALSYPVRRATVRYEDRLAYLEATVERRHDRHILPHPANTYPLNSVAEALFGAEETRNDNLNAHMGDVFGDAILVSDVQVHHAVHPRLITNPEMLAELTGSFETPHRVARVGWGPATILFDEEPIEADLVSLKLMFC